MVCGITVEILPARGICHVLPCHIGCHVIYGCHGAYSLYTAPVWQFWQRQLSTALHGSNSRGVIDSCPFAWQRFPQSQSDSISLVCGEARQYRHVTYHPSEVSLPFHRVDPFTSWSLPCRSLILPSHCPGTQSSSRTSRSANQSCLSLWSEDNSPTALLDLRYICYRWIWEER